MLLILDLKLNAYQEIKIIEHNDTRLSNNLSNSQTSPWIPSKSITQYNNLNRGIENRSVYISGKK